MRKAEKLDLEGYCIYRQYINILLVATQETYELVDLYKNINNKPLRRLWLPDITKYGFTNDNKPVITDVKSIGDAYILLYGRKQNEVIVNEESLSDYLLAPTNNIYPFPGVFPDAPVIDWAKSKIRYPNQTQTTEDAGKSYTIIVEYYDIPE